jgi:quercetin dioxygenase-like cupin family protein
LVWQRRQGSEALAGTFHDGHANAYVVGDDGLERHPHVRIGVSVMAPGQRYPDHRHPPEEVYVSLSDGAWWKAGSPWQTPGCGGLVYNPPDIMHAMQSGEHPLLAVWCLWSP